jgi:hypothetical protein
MNRKIFVFFIVTLNLVFNSACHVTKYNQSLFQMKQAYYQSWTKSENEKGTNIFIELIDVQDGIEFDSIIFRGNRLPVFVTHDGNMVRLQGMLNIGISRIQLDKKFVDKPDQLLYRYKGNRLSFLLKIIERKNMEYFKQ